MDISITFLVKIASVAAGLASAILFLREFRLTREFTKIVADLREQQRIVELHAHDIREFYIQWMLAYGGKGWTRDNLDSVISSMPDNEVRELTNTYLGSLMTQTSRTHEIYERRVVPAYERKRENMLHVALALAVVAAVLSVVEASLSELRGVSRCNCVVSPGGVTTPKAIEEPR